MAIILIIKTEDGQVNELPVLNKITLGRSGTSDYKITDIKMSGNHCTFEVNGKGQLIFKDLESTNGSFLNNSQINQTMVKVNDVIRIGNTLIKVEEKRLSSSERLAIGVSIVSGKRDKTLPVMPEDIMKNHNSSLEKVSETNPDKGPKKMAIVLNKNHKQKKKVGSNWAGAENVIDQEESSGNTKILKLNITPKVGKKKK
ncbi:MAG: FHA domain-containing protein [Bacteriovorax sp.]|nr:FHA domain-containing protein [Bacteriovorax sp.]